ncbi:hypothetical protein K457DRAFT_31955 [Linnemannia elongata AG-77]|uniref:Uncharacterized protein n=1 Tax=Linnemannia elongata AG-77 TaxID=1314771 RepID=A0A197JYA3_9FUNG|nr:hypothetical protein K457DRAFT_31955 [Linnemannia elongata AG-77]
MMTQTIHDLALVACCPLPPTPSIASATVTRIPFSLPGRRQPSLSRGGSVPGSQAAARYWTRRRFRGRGRGQFQN